MFFVCTKRTATTLEDSCYAVTTLSKISCSIYAENTAVAARNDYERNKVSAIAEWHIGTCVFYNLKLFISLYYNILIHQPAWI